MYLWDLDCDYLYYWYNVEEELVVIQIWVIMGLNIQCVLETFVCVTSFHSSNIY